MRVAKDDVFAGLPAKVAIRFIQQFYEAHPSSTYQPALDPSFGSEDDALVRLAAEGFVEADHVDGSGRAWWVATIKGNALAQAKLSPPITRATADRLLTGMVERAATVNSTSDYLFSVRRLRVFGSYLDASVDRLGDLDVGVALTARPHSPEDAVARARTSGRTFSTYMEELFWPSHEVVQFLKNRSRGLSLTLQDPSKFTTAFRDAFEDESLGESPGWQ